MPSLSIKNLGPLGNGVFTTEDIRQGNEVLEFKGEIKERSALGDLTHCLQIGPNQFLSSTSDIDDFVNHSCQPSCGIRLTPDGRVVLFALQHISAGSEITFDYATTQTGEHEILKCRCQKPNCRQLIGAFADLPDSLQTFYRKNNAVLPFLLQ